MTPPTQIAAEAARKMCPNWMSPLGNADYLDTQRIILTAIQQATEEGAKELKECHEEITRLTKGFNVEREWVASLTRDNGVLLKAADATKAGVLCVSQAGRIEHLDTQLASPTTQLQARDGVIARLMGALKACEPTIRRRVACEMCPPEALEMLLSVFSLTPATYADKLKEAEAALTAQTELAANYSRSLEKQDAEYHALRTALAKAEEDGRRLDWLEEKSRYVTSSIGAHRGYHELPSVAINQKSYMSGVTSGLGMTPANLRAAIDSARATEEGEGRR